MKLGTLDHVLDRLAGYVALASAVLAGVLLCFMVFLITVDVVGRAFFEFTTLIATAASGYSLVGVVFIGLAIAERADYHVKVEVVTRRLPRHWQHVFEIACFLMTIALVIWLTWSLVQLTATTYSNQTVSTDRLHIEMWIPYAVGPVGTSMYIVVLLSKLVHRLRAPKEFAIMD